MGNLWDRLDEKSKAKLKGRLPKTWRSPRSELGTKAPKEGAMSIETSEELERIMKQRPHPGGGRDD